MICIPFLLLMRAAAMIKRWLLEILNEFTFFTPCGSRFQQMRKRKRYFLYDNVYDIPLWMTKHFGACFTTTTKMFPYYHNVVYFPPSFISVSVCLSRTIAYASIHIYLCECLCLYLYERGDYVYKDIGIMM